MVDLDKKFNYRDGVSQADRQLSALSPDYIAIDERTLRDSLAFARQYGEQLKYFDDGNQLSGDWSSFMADVNVDEVMAFINDPSSIPGDRAAFYQRPHFVLFLSFLQLLEHSRQHLNTLTRRHLEFYYRDFLRLVRKQAQPDQVNILVELARNKMQAELPAGTLISAGKDSVGKELIYRTERTVVFNQAKVAQLRSVFVDKKMIGIRDAWVQSAGILPFEERFLNMLKIALGVPLPGDELPEYRINSNDSRQVDFKFLENLNMLVKFIKVEEKGFCMEFSEFEELMKFKKQRDRAGSIKENADWNAINKLLQEAGQKRAKFNGEPFSTWSINSRDFNKNFIQALKFDPYKTDSFGGIRDVENINELREKLENKEVQADLAKLKFFKERLFMLPEKFKELVDIKINIDNEWEQIVSILEQAGRRKKTNPIFSIKLTDPPDFANYLKQAFGTIEFPNQIKAIKSIDEYYEALQVLESYFSMPISDFSHLMEPAIEAIEANKAVEVDSNTVEDWSSILTDAYKEKVFVNRYEELKKIKEGNDPVDSELIIQTMAQTVLGEIYRKESNFSALGQLEDYIDLSEDFSYLTKVAFKENNNPDWEKIYSIFKVAWRNREGHDPVAFQEQWLNLYPAIDATAVRVDSGVNDDMGLPRWETFGRSQINVNQESNPLQSIGWAISSPLLQLSQGIRTITLTLTFSNEQIDWEKIDALFEEASSPFEIKLSGQKAWLLPSSTSPYSAGEKGYLNPVNAKTRTLNFLIQFDQNSDPSSSPSSYTSISSPWPILSVTLRQILDGNDNEGRYKTHYQPFKALRLSNVSLKVDVSELADFQIANDEAVLDPKSPFEPFGPRPVAGSRFYLGHPELVYKKIKDLVFDIVWMGKPDILKDHYSSYGESKTLDDNSFTASVSLVDSRSSVPLFNEPSTVLFNTPMGIAASGDYPIDFSAAISDENPKYWGRCFQWELNEPDFQHDVYPIIANKKAVELAAVLAGKVIPPPANIEPKRYVVKPPYTPKIKTLKLGYTSSMTVDLSAYQQTKQAERLFHIYPFGHSEIQVDVDSTSAFLPQFDHEGELYIGIEKLSPPQNLSLLMQMADGSADPDLEPVPIQWSYLSSNRWVSLEQGHILNDSTRGLINSGIVEFKLQPAQANSLLPPDLYWLRAAISRNSNSIGDTVAIHTQAVSAVFSDNGNAADHLSQPLPTGSIKRLVKPSPEIKTIRQPYTSFGGKVAEQDGQFYLRVSERLRHKQRALNAWDYEHLVLEHFPQIHKVKCLPAVLNNDDVPGTVVVVVIPNIRNQLPFDPFEPKAPANLIKDIETYLANITPAWATVKVKNPHYITVKVRVGVRFLSGYDVGYYTQVLHEELTRFLAPWAYEEGVDIAIGGRIYANSLINFIDKRPYVDYASNLKLFSSKGGIVQSSDEEGLWVGTGMQVDGILVSARQHEIDIIPETGYEEALFTGINYMKIELDFIVA